MSSRILAGRYELLEKIGEGGMAVVYKGRDRLLNRLIAVKILKPEYTKDHKFIESFRRESQAAASLSHPNIVNIYDVGKEGNINFIVMELIEGKALSEIIKEKGTLRPFEAVSITKQIASALSHAHKNHIIHRDVKPHNILLTEDGTAKIADFGIAKALNTSTIVGNTGTVVGSVHYFSPEQARGGYIDEKSDIYSLGVVLYEMLTGKVPFDADNPVAVAIKHMNEEIQPPSKLVKGIPKAIEDIVMKATDKFQINRFKNAEEMLESLNKASVKAIGVNGQTYERNYVQKTQTDKPEEKQGDKPVKNKKKFRLNKVKITAIILALICAIPVSQLILTIIEAGDALEEVIVPDVTGKTVEEARSILSEKDLELEIDKEVSSSEYDAGLIVSQDPLAEMVVKTGKTIKVNVSKGATEEPIPNVIGKKLSDAVFILESYGYTRGGVSEEYSQMPAGVVIRQSPKGGTSSEKGTSVNLVVSLGEEIKTTTVPNIIGLTVDQAIEILEEKNLKLGKTDFAPSNSYEQDLIIDQSIAQGSSVEFGTKVDITISTGPDESAGSGVIEIPIDYEEARNEVFYLTIMVSDSSGVSTPVNYEQRIKSDGSEMFTVTGVGQGTVRIYFDNALVQEYVVDFDTGAII